MDRPVLTVTLNAALDVTYRAERFRWGEQNRVSQVHSRAGGKGVNVARVLEQLGVRTLVTGLAGGLTGQAIKSSLQADGLTERLLEIEGESRRTLVAVSEADEVVTEFDEPGPSVGQPEWERFLGHFDQLVPRHAAVSLSGSLPPGVPKEAYAVLSDVARQCGVQVVLDSSGPALLEGLAGRPALVKPNLNELREAAADQPVFDVLEAARALQRRGAEAVVVSMGREGLCAVTSQGAWQAVPPEVQGNPVGAGDAVVAALIAGLLENCPWPRRLAMAAALSAAAVAHPMAGGYDAASYRGLLERTRVESL